MAKRQRDVRLAALRRFAVAITALNVAGHTVLGFEQAWIVPVAAVAAAYAMELGLEAVDAAAGRRRPRFAGGLRPLVDFLLPAHITGLAVSMLLYANARLWPIVFAVIVVTGTLLNGRLTGRLPLILGWLGGFACQAAVRSLVFGTPLVAGLLPMTGVAF